MSTSPACKLAFVTSGGVSRVAKLEALADADAEFDAGVPRQAVLALSQFCGDAPSSEYCAAIKCGTSACRKIIVGPQDGSESWDSGHKLL